MIVTPVFLAILLRRYYLSAWILFSIGSLTFILSQLFHLPLNNWLVGLGLLPGNGIILPGNLPFWRTALILGLTAGLSEELARALSYAFLQKFKPGWMRMSNGVMLGLGHGGIESMLIGGVLTAATISSLLQLSSIDLNTLELSKQQLSLLESQLRALEGSSLLAFAPYLERLIAISAHIMFSLFVWRAFARNNLRRDWWYILVAIGYHAAVDYAAIWLAVTMEDYSLGLHLLLAVVIVPGWLWVIWLWRSNKEKMALSEPEGVIRLPDAVSVRFSQPNKLWSEVRLFMAPLKKELLQQWRTRRIVVIIAVFLVFGMGSPLLAKFTPEIIGSIEEAKPFAELIPEPTTNDAMIQYIKNLTQFGFILAVLIGMGAVVGEKESGIAPIILSKPIPRWVYIVSKFVAQSIVYLIGFTLAAIGAWYYTVIVFGALDFGYFIFLNALLYLWLLTFVSVTLLGSTLGKSTGAAAGLGLGGAVLLLLANYLPRVGALSPGGLVAWAAQVGELAAGQSLEHVASNGGAVAMGIVIIIMANVLSVGIFEQQEL